MDGLLAKLRGALSMGATWAIGWTPVAVVIALVMEVMAGLPPGSLIRSWLIGIVPLGFLGGIIFSSLVGVLARRKRFDELSLPAFGFWGATGGLVLGSVAVALGLVGAGFGAGFGAREIAILATATLLSSGSAAGMLALARRATDERLSPGPAGGELAEPGSSGDPGLLSGSS